MTLSPKCLEAMMPFLHHRLSPDDFQQMVLFCYGERKKNPSRFVDRAVAAIRVYFAEQRRINNTLYNPYRNISFNQHLGDSKYPVSDWLNTSDWQEWD